MATANIYLIFDGECTAAFNLYKSVFGGEFSALLRYGEVPASPGMTPVAEADRSKIENVCLPLHDGSFLMGADGLESMGMKPVAGTNFSVYVNCSGSAETEKVFAGLSEGGTIMMPLSPTHWGGYFGICTDRFGIRWFVSTDQKE